MKADRIAKRDEGYAAHARDNHGRHLASECPECERVEGLERTDAALEKLSKNCNVLLEALRRVLENHGCPYCLDCAMAGFLIKYVEHYLETGTHLEPDAGSAPAFNSPDPRFEKIVAPHGYPVAQFYTRMMSTETADPNRFHLDRETLAGIVDRAEVEGESAGEYGRALKALDAAIQAWAQTPWDGR